MYNTEAPHKISYGSVYQDCKNLPGSRIGPQNIESIFAIKV